MDNPEYTESQINKALKAHTKLDITVSWDGYEPEQGATADFDVYLEGETTDVVVWDHGMTFDICERTDPHRYASMDWAIYHDDLAAKLINIIEEAIAAGKLGEYA
jgi:hypothetical protein